MNFFTSMEGGVVYVVSVGELIIDDQHTPSKVTSQIKVADEFNDEVFNVCCIHYPFIIFNTSYYR